MPKFRKKPIVIDAVQWTGDNVSDVQAMAVDSNFYKADDWHLAIMTLEGTMIAAPGDWIILGIAGELYPCKLDVFAATYDAVDE